MSFLKLENIGKIYVSENNVSVGIRGVNLSFERGEFVAVTGKSGSGKSTLLNVLSGMDTYEEGELWIEGEPTSHYQQKDWEEYRKQYISFIFQDYNIIESFTVLQNVELSLMHIEDPKARRQRALELLRRVGLEKQIHSRGSKLSGGQKQRTVIARALAKDSPIILADEPTGNLDSQTSKEIVELLREVSKDKLVIVVTHNFDQLEEVATRHIRIFDGAVEADEEITPTDPVSDEIPTVTENRSTLRSLRNGFTLGKARFGARPKLSLFLCVLMLLTALVITLITSLNADAKGLLDKNYMFRHIDGRCVIARTDGKVMTEEELAALSAKVGANSAVRYDFMLDQTVSLPMGNDCFEFTFKTLEKTNRVDVGRLPEKENEVMLRVPLSLKTIFGDGKSFEEQKLPLMMNAVYTVTGVEYFVDNTKTSEMFFTEEGYRIASALAFFENQKYYAEGCAEASLGEETVTEYLKMTDAAVDLSLPSGTWYVTGETVEKLLNEIQTPGEKTLRLHLNARLYENGYYDDLLFSYAYAPEGLEEIHYTVEGNYYENTPPIYEDYKELAAKDADINGYLSFLKDSGNLVISPDILCNFLYENYYKEAYTQASLFFESDRVAEKKAEELKELGYTAVVTTATAEEDLLTAIVTKIGMVFSLIGWILTILFATIFLNLCSSRAMGATGGDIAIMRSMGISTTVIKMSIYVQILFSLIPAFLGTGITCVILYLTPKTNAIFPFLHIEDYLILSLVLLIIGWNLSRKSVKKMFGESVKKTLKGGENE